MAEEIDFKVNSDISTATKDTEKFAGSVEEAQKAVDDLNENFKIQGKVIADLEDDVEGLEKKLLDVPKSAMGFSALNKQLKETKIELKGEKDAMKQLNAEMKDAKGNLKNATTEQKGLEKSTKKTNTATKLLKGGIKGIGMALKALGIGIIIAAFAALSEAVQRNQKAMDAINAIVTTVSTTFNQVVDVLIDTYEWVTASSDRFNGLGAVMKGIVTLALTPLKMAFFTIKLAVQGAMLAWENSFFGGGDEKKIAQLRIDIAGTAKDIEDTGKAAVEAGKSIITNFGDAVSEIGAIGSMAIDGISQISIKANYEQAKSTVAAQNSAKLAAASIQGLIEKYDREAELQRQIRDDTSAGMAERIAANTRLGEILDEQSEAMLKQQDVKIASAQFELAANKTNIDLQVALTEAINERAAIEAQITGFKSEQLVNLIALQQEQAALDQEAFDKKVEEENFLFELQNENLLASIENIEAKALKELEIQQAKDIAEAQSYDNKEAIIAEIDKKYAKKRELLEKKSAAAAKKMDKLAMKGKLDIAKQTFDNIATVMGKESKAGKAAAAAGAIVSTLQGATSAFASLAPIPFVGPVLGGIAAAAALVSGYANVKAIYATKDATGSSGGGGSPPAGDAPNISEAAANAEDETAALAPQMVGGAFELGGGVEPEAAKAYVVTDDMTDSQEQLAGIRRRASV